MGRHSAPDDSDLGDEQLTPSWLADRLAVSDDDAAGRHSVPEDEMHRPYTGHFGAEQGQDGVAPPPESPAESRAGGVDTTTGAPSSEYETTEIPTVGDAPGAGPGAGSDSDRHDLTETAEIPIVSLRSEERAPDTAPVEPIPDWAAPPDPASARIARESARSAPAGASVASVAQTATGAGSLADSGTVADTGAPDDAAGPAPPRSGTPVTAGRGPDTAGRTAAADPTAAAQAAQEGRGSRGDMALLRAESGLRARAVAAVLTPFVLYAIVLAVIGELSVFLLWIWIPIIVAGVAFGSVLDHAHRVVARRAAAAQPPDAGARSPEGPYRPAPGSEAPGSEAPGSEAPGSEAPGSEAPGSEAPGSEAPEPLDTGATETDTTGTADSHTADSHTADSETADRTGEFARHPAAAESLGQLPDAEQTGVFGAYAEPDPDQTGEFGAYGGHAEPERRDNRGG